MDARGRTFVPYVLQIAVSSIEAWRVSMIALPLREASSPAVRLREGRRPGRHIAALAAVGGLAVLCSAPAVAADITGLWMTNDGEGIIEIRPCGEHRCGRIAWTKDPLGPDGKISLDRNNPDPSLRSRRICGLQIITGLKPQADGTWADGRVYNPDNGQTYGMKIRRESADLVKAHGYLGFELFGQTQDWRRVAKNPGGCEDAAKRS
jgi:uncharacterized protein (DUF2147 family)